jgi:hypothetical protein
MNGVRISARSELGGTTSGRAPQWSVDAKRRPPQHAPLAGAAWRDALKSAQERLFANDRNAPTATADFHALDRQSA